MTNEQVPSASRVRSVVILCSEGSRQLGGESGAAEWIRRRSQLPGGHAERGTSHLAVQQRWEQHCKCTILQ